MVLVIGMQNTALFFLKRSRGAACFLGGILLVLFGWPMIGMAVEIFGIINLFGYALNYLVPFLFDLCLPLWCIYVTICVLLLAGIFSP